MQAHKASYSSGSHITPNMSRSSSSPPRWSSPPSSPNSLNSSYSMQLRDASERKRLADDAFEWSPVSTSSSAKESKRSVCDQPMPKLQPFIDEKDADFVPEITSDDSSSNPPALLPEISIAKDAEGCKDDSRSSNHNLDQSSWSDDDEQSWDEDCLAGLFQEPERVSSGKEEKVTIDGVDFLSFKTKADLLEFTAMDADYIRPYKTVDIDENWATIMPTKTQDITKIKGWRTKYFAGNTNYTENREQDAKEIGKRRRRNSDSSESTSPSLSKANNACFTDQGAMLSDEDGDKRQSRDSSRNSFGVSPGKSQAGKISLSPKYPKPLDVKNVKSEGPSDNLDINWVEFAVSALVWPPAAGKHDCRATTSKRKEDEEDEDDERKLKQKQFSKKLISRLELETRVGRPVHFPLSSYMKKKLSIADVKPNKRGRKPKPVSPPKYVPEGSRKVNQIIRHVVNSLVAEVDSTINQGKIIEASEEGKAKTNRELKKLGHVLIDIDEKAKFKADNNESYFSSECNEEFCKLGCVCSSLASNPGPAGHCGKVECMFECECKEVPRVVAERLIEDEKRDLAPAEKDFKNAMIRAENGIMMVKQRGRRQIKLPGRFRDGSVLTGDALMAAEQSILKIRGPAKITKEEDEPQSEVEPRRARKSLLKDIKTPPLNNSSSKKSSANDDSYFNVPSPERLDSCENDSKNASLYNSVGGFISLDLEKKFLASQTIKVESPELDDDCVIEIDDMGWQDAEDDLPVILEDTNHATLSKANFGKIIHVTSLDPEEFDRNPFPLETPELTGSNHTQHVKENDASVASVATNNVVTNELPNCTVPSNDSCTVPSNGSTHVQAANPSSQSENPVHKRLAAKQRAKKLAEFFTPNSNVSTLVKSAYEFNPSVLEENAITLLQWSTLKSRLVEKSISLWIKRNNRDFHFLVTEPDNVPKAEGYANLESFRHGDVSQMPEVARQMLLSYTSITDYQRCCILWCNGIYWEFIGTLLKNKPVPAAAIAPNSKPKVTKVTYLPKDKIVTKWYSLLLNNDFEAIELKNEKVLVTYGKLNQVMGAAWRYKKTAYIEIEERKSAISFQTPFGLYAKPNDHNKVFLGPYHPKDHAILEIMCFPDIICKSVISQAYVEAQRGPKGLDGDTEDEENSDSSSDDDPESEARKLNKYVSSKGRVRKVPKYLIEDEEHKEHKSPPVKRARKIPQHLLDCEIPTLIKTLDKKTPEKEESLGKRQRRMSIKDDIKIPKKSKSSTKQVPEKVSMEEECHEVIQSIKNELDWSNDGISMDDVSQSAAVKENNEPIEVLNKEPDKGEPDKQTTEPVEKMNDLEEPKEEANTQNVELVKIKKVYAIKVGTLAKLECSFNTVKPLPIVIYDDESVRLLNPFGKRVAHFENLDLAKRFLNFVFEQIFKEKKIKWIFQLWSADEQEIGNHVQQFLQTSRARMTPLRHLNSAIGREDRNAARPVRFKWRSFKIKSQLAIHKILEECYENKAFDNPETAMAAYVQHSELFWNAILKKCMKERRRPKLNKHRSRELIHTETSGDIASDDTSSSVRTDQNIDEDSGLPKSLYLHRDMEKTRRKELAQRFRDVAALLVTPDMLPRCTKIMVLQQAVLEVQRVKELESMLQDQRALLESKREDLFKAFSVAIEGLDRKKRITAVHALKEMLDFKSNKPKDDSYKNEVSTPRYIPALAEIKNNCDKYAQKEKLSKPVESTSSSFLIQDDDSDDSSHSSETSTESGVSESDHDQHQEMDKVSSELPLPALSKKIPSTVRTPASNTTSRNTNVQLYPLHLLASAQNVNGSFNDQGDMPCHVRISKDGKLYLPPTSSQGLASNTTRVTVVPKMKISNVFSNTSLLKNQTNESAKIIPISSDTTIPYIANQEVGSLKKLPDNPSDASNSNQEHSISKVNDDLAISESTAKVRRKPQSTADLVFLPSSSPDPIVPTSNRNKSPEIQILQTSFPEEEVQIQQNKQSKKQSSVRKHQRFIRRSSLPNSSPKTSAFPFKRLKHKKIPPHVFSGKNRTSFLLQCIRDGTININAKANKVTNTPDDITDVTPPTPTFTINRNLIKANLHAAKSTIGPAPQDVQPTKENPIATLSPTDRPSQSLSPIVIKPSPLTTTTARPSSPLVLDVSASPPQRPSSTSLLCLSPFAPPDSAPSSPLNSVPSSSPPLHYISHQSTVNLPPEKSLATAKLPLVSPVPSSSVVASSSDKQD